ncbi:uncharacterized protein LOC130662973 [Microplitis mediator]|uniref:uncharacterized protein LOC130662973 n=1 Tax=Microplitis mediator TaxID=375433 RepID=UPI002554D88D|nr:uncharacterized protein LOC130662973 [Microplitis mediator]
MGRYAVVRVRLDGRDEDEWGAIPELWVTVDKKKCWWPDNDIQRKAENQIIFNGSSKGWTLLPVGDVYRTYYKTLNDAVYKADDLNRKDLKDKKLDEINKKLCLVETKLDLNYSVLLYKQRKMDQDFEEMSKTLNALKNHVDANKSTLGALLPIKDPKDLITFETLFLTESWISPALKELIIILTDDENINQSISKILGAVFSNQLAAQCSWDGQNGIKIKDLSIIKKIDVTLKNINANYERFERDVTLWFEKNRKSAITPD